MKELGFQASQFVEKQKRYLGLTRLNAGEKYTKEFVDKLVLHTSSRLVEQGTDCCSDNNSEESDLLRRLENLPVPKQHAIYRLSTSRSEDAKYLTPRAVFIGPYHHRISYRSNMTYHKFRFFKDFLLRNPSKSSEHYREEIRMLEPQLRKYYSWGLDTRRDKFVNLMVLDGCFILEFLIKYYNHDPDEIFENDSLLRDIKTDLLMFENQIPFMVLLKLYGLQNTGSLPCIYHLLVNYFWDTSNGWPTLRSSGCHNLLHFYHLQFVPPYVNEDQRGKNSKEHHCAKLNEKFVSQIPSVKQLEKAGVILRGKRTTNFLDITFRDGVLEIPTISMDDPVLLFFVNLAVFEKNNVAVGKVVQTYCCFMHCLVRNPYDVELLHTNGIIENSSISNQELLDLFGRFQNADYMNSEKHFYADLFVDLWEFCEKVEKTDATVQELRVKGVKAFIAAVAAFLFHIWIQYYVLERVQL
jgi:Plant protein of unknown function